MENQTSPSTKEIVNNNHQNFDRELEYNQDENSCSSFDSNLPKFGLNPHPKFDAGNVMDKLRNITVGRKLLDAVHQNINPRDSVVEEIMNEARRKLLEPGLLPEDIIEPVDKVYTIGCFDVFHPGHELLLKRLRAYGRKVCVGVHDSDSIHQLKGIWPVDSTAKRMFNVKEYADVVFCVAGTDPTPFIISAIDLQKGETALYIRGNDMENFPSRDVVSAIMPVKLLPYSSGISSSQLRRTIRSLEDEAEEPTDSDSTNGSSSVYTTDQDQCSLDACSSEDTRDSNGIMSSGEFGDLELKE